MVDPGVDDADEGAVHPEVEPQQAEEARRHHALEWKRELKVLRDSFTYTAK